MKKLPGSTIPNLFHIYSKLLRVACLCSFLFLGQILYGCSGITIVRTSAPYFILDSNKPCIEGPSAGYMAIRITNNGLIPLTNVTFKLDSITVSTKFKLLAPTDSSHFIYRLAPGASVTYFFYLKSPCVINEVGQFNYSLRYNSGLVCLFNTSIVARSAISSNAGGIVLTSVSNSTALGNIIMDTVTQSLGLVQTNDEMEFQPSSLSSFRADAYELIAVKVLASNIPAIPVGRLDSIYFKATSNVNPGNVKFVYFFKVKKPYITTKAMPLAGARQGGTNYKYKFDTSGIPTFPVASIVPVIAKTVNKYYNLPGDTVKYTITVFNTATVPISFDRIIDILPAGISYKRIDSLSPINSSNCAVVPFANDSGTITFIGGVPTIYWPYTSFYIPGSDSISVMYWAKIGLSNVIRTDTNTAKGYIDDYAFDTAKAVICVGCVPLSVNDLKFRGYFIERQTYLSWEVPDKGTSHDFMLYKADQYGEYQKLYETTSSRLSEMIYFKDLVGEIANGTSLYYKLVHTDISSGITKDYFITVKQIINTNTSRIVIFENPVNNKLEIRALQKLSGASIQILNTTGQIITAIPPCSLLAGETITVNVEGLKPGMYSLLLTTVSNREVYKIIKQ